MSRGLRLRPVLAAVSRGAALGCVAMLLLSGHALLVRVPAAAADGPQGRLTLDPAAVQSPTDPFSLRLAGDARCEEDGTGAGPGSDRGPRTGADDWRWHGFVVEAGRDLATLEFGAYGPGDDFDATDGDITAGLFLAGSEGVWQQLPALKPEGHINPDELSGLVLDPAIYTLVDGQYELGFACTDGRAATRQWWSVTVRVDTSGTPFLTEASAEGAPGPRGSGETTAAGRADGDRGSGSAPTDSAGAGAAGSPVEGVEASSTAFATGAPDAPGVPPAPTGVSWSPLLSVSRISGAVPLGGWTLLAALFARIAFLLATPVRVPSPTTP